MADTSHLMFDHPDGEPVLVLDEEQIWKLLEHTAHGRLVVVPGGRVEIFPFNFAVQDRTLVMRTGPGNKLAGMAVDENVVVEADGILDDQAWSVVLRGRAQLLESEADRSRAEELNLKPWVPTAKDFYVRITPDEVSGRHFAFGPHPEREH